MSARRALIESEAPDEQEFSLAAFQRGAARRAAVEDDPVVEELFSVTAHHAARAGETIVFEPDEPLTDVCAARSATATAVGQVERKLLRTKRAKRTMLGAAAAATVGAALVLPNALSGVSAQSDVAQAVSNNREQEQVTRDDDRAPVVDPVSGARAIEEIRKAEEARAAEQGRLADEARAAEESRKAEESRIAEEARAAEEARKAEEAASTPSPVAPGNSGTAPIQQPGTSAEPPVTGSCAHGDGSSLGLTPQAKIAFQAICARFPNVTSYGGWRPSSDDHGAGQAIDIMISGSEGWEIANWLVANSATYSVEYVIFEQRIWGSWAPGAGFTWMDDRGSPTQNHYDHVHVTVR